MASSSELASPKRFLACRDLAFLTGGMAITLLVTLAYKTSDRSPSKFFTQYGPSESSGLSQPAALGLKRDTPPREEVETGIPAMFRKLLNRPQSSNPIQNDTIIVGKDQETLVWDPRMHIYRLKGKPIIWVFWTGDSLPPLIQASMATVLCHNHRDFHLEIVREKDVPLWLDHVHPAFPFLIPAHKADYFRGRILDLYGGAYLDADTLCFSNLWHLFHKLLWYDVINMSWPPDGDPIAISNMGPVRARTKFTAKWVTDLHQVLDSKLGSLESHKNGKGSYPLQWAEMLRNIVSPLVRDLLKEDKNFAFFSMTGHKTFGQLVSSGYGGSTRLSELNKGPFKFLEYEFLIYHNSQISGEIRDKPLADFMKSDLLLAELIRHSLRVCKLREDDPKPINQVSSPKEIVIEKGTQIEGAAELTELTTRLLKENGDL